MRQALVTAALAGFLMAASCGDSGASKVVPVQDLVAEVCTDGDGERRQAVREESGRL